MNLDDKVTKILEDVAVIRTVQDTHSVKLSDLETKLEPVLYHVNGIKWALRVGGAIIGVITCLAGVLLLLK